MTSKKTEAPVGLEGDWTLTDALRVIRPERGGLATDVLTVCCVYLRARAPMPPELCDWLDKYLTSERRQISGTRGINMANLAVELRKTNAKKQATGRGKLSRTQAEFARAQNLDESTLKKWRKKPEFRAADAVHRHLLTILGVKLSD